MSLRRSSLPFATALASALLLTGCPRLICERDPELRADGRYRITILEIYDPQTTFVYAEGLAPQQAEIRACPPNLRPSAGVTLDLQAIGDVQPFQSCPRVRSDVVAASAEVGVIGPSSAAAATAAAQGIRGKEEANALIAVDDVTIGGCNGTVGLSAIPAGGPGGFYAAPLSGQRPPAVLYWFFESSGTGCSPPCQVSFAVQVDKL